MQPKSRANLLIAVLLLAAVTMAFAWGARNQERMAKAKADQVIKDRQNAVFQNMQTAAIAGDLRRFEKLLSQVPRDVALQQNFVFWAASNGQAKVVLYLLKNGWGPDGTSRRGAPIVTAAADGRTEIVDILLKHGARVDPVEVRGSTALTMAAMNGHTEVVKRLLEAGANVNVVVGPESNRQQSGRTALIFAAEAGRVETVRLLLAHGARADYTSPTGISALRVAIEAEQPEIMEMLLKAGATQ